ncbi:MAG: hypothetical protein JSS86_19745, partial [Cyanobacteria bacterium SZAS LIN-2]|nr:hypothetical protein [Cyanobacteria bacterium SZAS LIN-2]
DALNLTESEITEEIKIIQQQIEELKNRIVELTGKQETLAHDRTSISEMVERYCATENGAQST